MSESKLFAVAGSPVLHSRSPQIFNALFQTQKLDAVYFRLAADSGAEIVETAKSMPLGGFNVTSPYKTEIMDYLDDISDESLQIGAVNTVVAESGGLKGYNTDHSGVVETLKQSGTDLKNKYVTILGAGGAARAAAFGAIRERAKKVVFLNRTIKNAEAAAVRLGCDFAPWKKRADVLNDSEILISCISTGQSFVEPDLLHKGLIVLDANYRDSQLLNDAAENGCRTLSGERWLINQALPAFKLMAGQNAPFHVQHSAMNFSRRPAVRKPNLALIGFMGTGKTTVGQRLSESLGFEFLDIDAAIEDSAGIPIDQIFKIKGEQAFRRMEKETIDQTVSGSKKTIFALGGGAILQEENRAVLRRECTCIWLWGKLQSCLLHLGSSSRPLLESESPEKTAQALLSARMPLYAETSDVAIVTESKSPEQTTKRIRHEMDQTF